MSLRIKLMLALLLTGLAAVAVVGGLTYASVDRNSTPYGASRPPNISIST